MQWQVHACSGRYECAPCAAVGKHVVRASVGGVHDCACMPFKCQGAKEPWRGASRRTRRISRSGRGASAGRGAAAYTLQRGTSRPSFPPPFPPCFPFCPHCLLLLLPYFYRLSLYAAVQTFLFAPCPCCPDCCPGYRPHCLCGSYPDPTEYKAFLSQHGGGSNASTSMVHTAFHLTVHHARLAPALDRMAAMFAAPRLAADAVLAEVENVHAEFSRNCNLDARKLLQVRRARCKPGAFHPVFCACLQASHMSLLARPWTQLACKPRT
eukprot:357985-Chlamydomonas_euryale.AAC.8